MKFGFSEFDEEETMTQNIVRNRPDTSLDLLSRARSCARSIEEELKRTVAQAPHSARSREWDKFGDCMS